MKDLDKKPLRGFVAPIRSKKVYSWFKIFQQETFCDFHQDIGIIFKFSIVDVKHNFSFIFSDNLFEKDDPVYLVPVGYYCSAQLP
jgi:hypothetical protein